MVFYDGQKENHIILDGEIPERFKRSQIDTGRNTVCYITDDGDVFKLTKCLDHTFIDFVNLAKLKSTFFTFPKLVLYDKERKASNVLGYTMDFATGSNLGSLDPQVDIRDLINAIYELEKEVARLTREENLQLYDLNTGNIFYDAENKKIRVIDTDLYSFSPCEDPYEERELLKLNMQELSRDMLYLLVGSYNFKDNRINNHFEMCTRAGKWRADEILNEILEAIEAKTQGPVKTIGRFKECLPAIKN